MLSTQSHPVSPEVIVYPTLANWYCTGCRKYIASVEMGPGRLHEDCGGKVIWRDYVVQVVPTQAKRIPTAVMPA